MQTLEEISLNWRKVHLTACLPASFLLQGAATKDWVHALKWKQTFSLAMVDREKDLPKAACPTKTLASLLEMFPSWTMMLPANMILQALELCRVG